LIKLKKHQLNDQTYLLEKTICCIGIYGLLRGGEIKSLEFNDVKIIKNNDAEEVEITIKKSKTDKKNVLNFYYFFKIF